MMGKSKNVTSSNNLGNQLNFNVNYTVNLGLLVSTLNVCMLLIEIRFSRCFCLFRHIESACCGLCLVNNTHCGEFQIM